MYRALQVNVGELGSMVEILQKVLPHNNENAIRGPLWQKVYYKKVFAEKQKEFTVKHIHLVLFLLHKYTSFQNIGFDFWVM